MDTDLFTSLATWILYFIIYGVIGYIFEVIYCSIQAGELKNRGFLYGPVVPIYAFGALIIVATSDWLNWPWWGNFFLCIILCDTLEYLTSILLEKIFHMRWWDYSKNNRFHLNGRISLRTSLCFGFGGLMIIYWMHPLIAGGVGLLPDNIAILLAALLFGIYLMDTILSTIMAFKVKGMLDGGEIDVTAQIKKYEAHYYEVERRKRQKRWRKYKNNLKKKFYKKR